MKRFLIIFISWVIVFSLLVVGIFYINNRDSNNINSSDIPEDISEVNEPEDDLTFVMMGVDAETDEQIKGQRTDTIMVCKYFKQTNKLAVLSIPRDTLVKIPGHGEDKINHAHAYGGPELTLKTINNNFDLNIKYYVRVDYDVVKEVVDTLNGVEVDVPMDMKYEDPYADPPLKINLKKGKQVLNGDKSLQFLRFRSGYPEQDLGRIKAQQSFVQSLLKKAKNPLYILKAPMILKSTGENISTNMSVKDILSYTTAITKISGEKTQFETLPADPQDIDGISYVIVREDEVEDVIFELFEKSTVTKKEINEAEESKDDKEDEDDGEEEIIDDN
ncbi:MAG: LCP family protein [Andreesenia angusta]|nr:LCP family protein [Andreesenia angusta]